MLERAQTYVQLIPAHAGVIPGKPLFPFPAESYPRACGGDPMMIDQGFNPLHLSPRMRG